MKKSLLEALQLLTAVKINRFFVPDGIARLQVHCGGEQPYDRLIFTLSGQKDEWMSLGGNLVQPELGKGDVCLFAKGIWEYGDVSKRHDILCIIPRPGYLRISFYQFAGGEWVQPEAIHTTRPVPVRLLKIFEALLAPGDPDSPAVGHLLHAAVICALTECDAGNIVASGKAADTFEIIRSYIDHHYTYCLNREILAAKFGCNANYISQLFRQMAKMSVHAYIEQRRFELARELLAQPRLSVKEIAGRCGFSSDVYFVRRFRELYGIAPGRSRREL